MKEESQRSRFGSHSRLGLTCLAVIIVIVALSVPLRCITLALRVGGVSLLSGAGLGTALAMVTRSRRPVQIYLWLAVAAVTFLPMYRGWPPGDSFDVFPWRGAPEIFYNYFDILRGGVFLLAMPYPFARFGQHAPDPLPPGMLTSRSS